MSSQKIQDPEKIKRLEWGVKFLYDQTGTLKEAAKFADVSYSSICRVHSGEGVSPRIAKKILDAVEVLEANEAAKENGRKKLGAPEDAYDLLYRARENLNRSISDLNAAAEKSLPLVGEGLKVVSQKLGRVRDKYLDPYVERNGGK